MSDNSDPIDVIIDDSEEQNDIRIERTENARSSDPEDGIESLKSQLEEERRARAEADHARDFLAGQQRLWRRAVG